MLGRGRNTHHKQCKIIIIIIHILGLKRKNEKTALEVNVLVKMVSVMNGRKLHRTVKIFAADHSYSESPDKTFLVSLFQLLLFHRSIKICMF